MRLIHVRPLQYPFPGKTPEAGTLASRAERDGRGTVSEAGAKRDQQVAWAERSGERVNRKRYEWWVEITTIPTPLTCPEEVIGEDERIWGVRTFVQLYFIPQNYPNGDRK